MADNNNQGGVLTEADLEKMIREELAKSMSEEGKKTVDPIKIKVKGEEFTFTDADQLGKNLENLVSNYERELANKLGEVEQLKSSQGSYVQDDDGPKFDPKEWAKMMESGKVLEARDYEDNFRYFDGKVNNASQVMRQKLAESDQLKETVAVYQFKDNHPELPPAGLGQHAKTINEVRERLGLPFTSDGLEAAYQTAIGRGMIPNFVQLAQAAQLQQQQNQYSDDLNFDPRFEPQNRQRQGLPNVNSRRSSTGSDPYKDLEGMSLQQVEALWNKAKGL